MNRKCGQSCLTCQNDEKNQNPFSYLTMSEQVELGKNKTLATFKKGEFLFRSGEPVQGIFCLSQGNVKITQLQGQRPVTLRFASMGEWVGHRSIFTSETYRGSAQAKGPVHACLVPTRFLLHLLESNRNFGHRLIQQIAIDLEKTEKKLLEYQSLNVPGRLISLFRSLDEKFGISAKEGRMLSIKITKVEISEMVGASQEVVSRQLSQWKKDNLLYEDGKTLCLSTRLLERVIR